ncbi:Rha family phage regulatory protein [Klebsiella aerogenes]|uniref:Rha family phage regulatory protein n=1 Tax=Klebsiella aerogenes TaxID=548 RepID=UPI001F255C84|nr:Rha family phage regulatory protein [Klebsiella aerogenes]
MNLHIDSMNFGRYSARTAAKSVVGRGNPELVIEHNRSRGFFVLKASSHLSMVGRAGQSSDWPVSVAAGISTPVRLTTSWRGNHGGEVLNLTTEAAIMATTPSISHPEITLSNGRAVTTSLAVAAYFSKRHDNIIQKIHSLECSSDFIALNFKAVGYTDSKGESRPAYEITRSGFMFLVMGFTGKKAAHLKESYINAFDAMEARLQTGVQPADEINEIVVILKNGIAVDSRPVRKGQIIATLDDFLDMAGRYGYLVIHQDDLKDLSQTLRKRGRR